LRCTSLGVGAFFLFITDYENKLIEMVYKVYNKSVRL